MNVAENFGAGTDQYTITNFRVAVPVFFTGATQRDGLQNGHAVADHSRFTDDQAGGMVQHDAVTKTRCRVNIDTELPRHLALQKQRQRLSVMCSQPVPDAVNLQRLKTLEVQKRNVQLMAGGIPIENRVQVVPNCASDIAVIA